MNKIILEIAGSQRIDSQKDKTEMTTIGTIEETADSIIIKYTEEQEPPLTNIDVSVTLHKDEKLVEITRSGACESCLIIEKSKRNLCRYGTEYGDILMGISGHTIDSAYNGDSGRFTFNYDIDVNGAIVSHNEIKLNFRKNQE